MENIENTGVENTAAAEQVTTEAIETTESQQTQEQTGVESKPAAEVNENVEKAFAARLKDATEKAKREAYEEAKKETAQQARDEWIASQGYEWKGKTIKTEAEYNEAIREKELETKIRKQYENVPDEIVNELLESRKFREQYQAKEKEFEQKESERVKHEEFNAIKTSMYNEFAEEFSDYVNNDEKMKTIPKEVWSEADKWLKSGGREGRRLADSLFRYLQNQQQQQQNVQNANDKNANSSTGSVKSNGNGLPHFTREQVMSMSRAEIDKNYDAIKESEKHWK